MSSPGRILSILVFLVFLTGCKGGFSRNVSAATFSCQPPSLEDCYTEDQMQAYLDKVAIPYVDKFSQDSYSHMPLPKYTYIPEGQTFASKCGQLGETAYAFCPSEDAIYIGQKQEWQFYRAYGSVSPVFGVAQEFGHYIQLVTGVP